MLAIIGNQVAQGEAIMVRYIIKYSFLSGIMPKPMHDLRHHALVPFQETAHDGLEAQLMDHDLGLL